MLAESFRIAQIEQAQQSKAYYEFDIVDGVEVVERDRNTEFWEKTGKTIRELFSVKSAYASYKERDWEKGGGDMPNLSDTAEVEKEAQDEANRPSHMKKDVLFKSYIDMMGESAVLPWFKEVEKVVRQKKIYFDRTFETTVIVVINSAGRVVKVVLAKSSGDSLLDIAVRQAFLRQAYPRAPAGLIDSDGFGRVKWVFEMYLNVDLRKKGKFRIYRRD